ncbi:hypothetical protein AVEN_227221-1 [Araneus ventricosus]|uniref:Uncharacterized protein n=1 Tax=Araneus ventricosus TaxID=182803 RepID=A0A4Y2CXA2_ARAVE|nr:hypothetical protein AVEN_227221-1 [Araneus ventricosus]
MTAEKFLSCLIKAIQSGQEIPLDAAFIVDVIVIQRPVGGGGKGHHRAINIATDRLRKKSVLSIMPEETAICCAKAILLALASKESPTELKSLCDARNTVLERRAIKLHNDVGIPLGPCGVNPLTPSGPQNLTTFVYGGFVDIWIREMDSSAFSPFLLTVGGRKRTGA